MHRWSKQQVYSFCLAPILFEIETETSFDGGKNTSIPQPVSIIFLILSIFPGETSAAVACGLAVYLYTRNCIWAPDIDHLSFLQ